MTGDVPNVVFPCGLVHDDDTDVLSLYYGAADTRVGLATANRSTVLEYLLECPPVSQQAGPDPPAPRRH